MEEQDCLAERKAGDATATSRDKHECAWPTLIYSNQLQYSRTDGNPSCPPLSPSSRDVGQQEKLASHQRIRMLKRWWAGLREGLNLAAAQSDEIHICMSFLMPLMHRVDSVSLASSASFNLSCLFSWHKSEPALEKHSTNIILSYLN